MFSVRICDALGSEIDYPFAVDVDDDEEEEEEEEEKEEEDDDDDDEDDDDYVCGSVKRRGFNSQNQPRKSARRSVDSKSKDHSFKHFQTRNVSFIKKEDEDEDDEDEEEEININNKKKKSHIKQEVGEAENEMIVPRSFIYSKGRTVVSKRTKKAVQAAYASKLHNPSFLVVVKRNMEVPAEFVRRHMKFCPERVQLQASNDERNIWAVRCYYVHQDRALVKRLGQGWSSFSSSQGLKKGDVCVFEMIRMVDGAVFRVWIYRAAEYA
ncbi:B3 domain-containing protein REM19-like [Humulus lupulus]|uniref:B3 domain-containing protein REM19-like n=1 Tax=Humulus lupulus TaxID=3486 RepID=UPI002B40BC8B|nr:B3 domain-containing protein REM19-like [Humulus lupulus]